MAKKTGSKRSSRNALDTLLGGKDMPDAFVRERMAAAKRGLSERKEEPRALFAKAAQQFGRFRAAAYPERETPEAERAAEDLLDVHRKLAKRKLVAPNVLAGGGGVLSGRFTARITPPYDYSYWVPFTNIGGPALSGAADHRTGKLAASAVTRFDGPSHGTTYSELGVYLRPFAGPVKLRISTTISYWKEWWINSLKHPLTVVRSRGSITLGLWAMQGRVGPSDGAQAVPESWDESTTEELRFDFDSIPERAVSVEHVLSPAFDYSIYVALVASGVGGGWPKGIAGSMLALTVPYIDLDYELIPVLSQG